MKLNKGLIAVILVFALAFSVASVVQKQKEYQKVFQSAANFASAEKLPFRDVCNLLRQPTDVYGGFNFLSVFNLQGTLLQERAPLPDNSTRTEIYNFVNANPGVQFRAICSSLGLSIGVVQFHLAVLEKSGLITSIRKGKYKRFFTKGFSKAEKEAIATLRLDTVKNILKALLQGKRVSHHELAVHLNISSQGLTWQMNRLRETGLVQETRDGLNVTYTLEQTYVPIVAEAITLVEANTI